jgi:hypothetical protein
VWDFDVGHIRCVEVHNHERGRREARGLVDEEVGAFRVVVVGDDNTGRD